MRIRIVFFLLGLSASAAAQTPNGSDSLLQVARTAPTDTARVWAFMEAGKRYLNTQADTAALYIGQALELAKKTGFERGQVKCFINLAFAFNNLGRYPESVSACRAALPIARRLGMKKEQVAAWNNLGNAFDYLGNRRQAIDAFSNALQTAEGVSLPPQFPLTIRNNIARQYIDLNLYDKGLEYAGRTLADATVLGDSAEVAAALQYFVEAALKQGKRGDALRYSRRILSIAHQEDLPILEIFALNNIGALVFDQHPKEAEDTIRLALNLAQGAGDLFGEISAHITLARLGLYRKNFLQAHLNIEKGLQLARKAEMDDEMANCYLILSDLALAEGRMDLFREYREQYGQMSDTLANHLLVHATQDLETHYQTAQKEQQLAQMVREQEIQQLRLRQKNGLIAGLGALSLLLLAVGALTIRNLRNRRRLAEQALQLQQQQLIQLRQEQQISVADAVLNSQEDERRRLAQDLHDGLGGMLSGIKQSLNGMKGNQILSETAATALNRVVEDLDRSIGELRHIARNMMPEALVRFGLRDALHDYCDHMQESSGLLVNFQSFGYDRRLPQQTEVILFRIAQELLNNTVKHAGAKNVLVQLILNDGRIGLTVEDDGKGFDPEKLKSAPGVGWLNIQSRVDYLNGTLDLHTRPGGGTSVSISLAE